MKASTVVFGSWLAYENAPQLQHCHTRQYSGKRGVLFKLGFYQNLLFKIEC